MLRRTAPNAYFLAFNPKAKARPNFGLRGVGYYTSETYHKNGHNIWGALMLPAPFIALFAVVYNGLFAIVDDIAGGGPQEIDWVRDVKINTHAQDKPWNFMFPLGEGFANGPARYRPAPGATPLHH